MTDTRLARRLSAPARPRILRLGNGLTVLTREMRQTPIVSVWCWYRVGSRNERPGITGIAHWVEHMNFKGTRRIPKEQVVRQVELAGGTWNGYTWMDVTTYLETVSKDALEAMLRLEASRMTECLHAPAEVERERTVVISEMQGGENDPRTYLDREVTGTALQAHPYRWPTIGYLSDLRAITREDLYAFYRRYYVPNNAVLVLTGDFDTGAAWRLVRRHFGRIPRGPDPPAVRTVEPSQCGERRVVLRRPSGATYLQVAHHAPAAREADFPVMLIIDALLLHNCSTNIWAGRHGEGPGKSSWLYRALVEADLATEVSSLIAPTRDPYLYVLQATVKQEIDPARVETALYTALDRLARGDFGARDLQRARNHVLARYALESESPTDLAHQLGYFETIGDHRLFLDLPRRVCAVGPADVRRVARDRFTTASRTVGVLRPAGADGGDA